MRQLKISCIWKMLTSVYAAHNKNNNDKSDQYSTAELFSHAKMGIDYQFIRKLKEENVQL